MSATQAAIDGRAVLRAVLERPGDDLPRLAYADWCEETGQGERAEFIRVQIEIAGMADCPEGICCGCSRLPRKCRWHELSEREDRLAGDNVSQDGKGVLPRYYEWARQAGIDPAWLVVPGFCTGNYDRKGSSFRRGFVASIRCPLRAWLDHAEAICRAHPVERVEISDRQPAECAMPDDASGAGWHQWPDAIDRWFSQGSRPLAASRLCEEIWRRLPEGRRSNDPWARFRDERDARDALSRACIAYGREKAGLPPLEKEEKP